MGLEQLREAQLVQLLGGADPVEIGMGCGHAGFLVALDEGEGRARHVKVGAAGKSADEGARKGGLAGTQFAPEQDRHSGPREQREFGGKFLKRCSRIEAAGHVHGGQAVFRVSCTALPRCPAPGPSTGKVQRTVVPWLILESSETCPS